MKTARLNRYRKNISSSKLDIYAEIEVGNPELWVPTPELEQLLSSRLVGKELGSLPQKTRSKLVKQLICDALGYPTPKTFKRTKPRFKGQQFDVYTQASDNLQIWNEEITGTRRYVLLRPSPSGRIIGVKVVNGEELAKLDRTGTLTGKYQARWRPGSEASQLVSESDTPRLAPLCQDELVRHAHDSPTDEPAEGQLSSIRALYKALKPLLGAHFIDPGSGKDRARGAELHSLVCRALGYTSSGDNGQFPDVRNELLEIKLQTANTIDLGLVSPASEEPLDVPKISDRQIRHCDTRYAVFFGRIEEGEVTLQHLVLSTGEQFFSRFDQFQGMVKNQKIQLPIPKDFFTGKPKAS